MATYARKQDGMADVLELPKYRSHKVVQALKIEGIQQGTSDTLGGTWLLYPTEQWFPPIEVAHDWVTKREVPFRYSDGTDGTPTGHYLTQLGYFVVYDNGYTSWSPVEAFESGYTALPGQEGTTATFTFGAALDFLKAGYAVARSGWNGKGMWLSYSPGSKALPSTSFWSPVNRDYAEGNGGTADVLPCITMKTATGEILMGWLASQTDMLADDWRIVTIPASVPDRFGIGDKVMFQPGPDQPKSGPHVVLELKPEGVIVAGIGVALPRKYLTVATMLLAFLFFSNFATAQGPTPKPPRSVDIITAELKQHAAQMQAVGGTMAQLQEFQAYVREEQEINKLQQELQAATRQAPPATVPPAPKK